MAKKKLAPKAEIHYLRQANKASVLSKSNIRWRQGATCLLYDEMERLGSERDVAAYILVGDILYAADRFLVDGPVEVDGQLRVFLGICPVLLEMPDAFAGAAPAPVMEVSETLKQDIIARLHAVRQMVIDEWIKAFSLPVRKQNLAQLLHDYEPLRFMETFSNASIMEPVSEAMGVSHDWDELQRIYSLIGRDSISLPEWAGAADVLCDVYQANGVGRRHWSSVKKGIWVGSLRAKLRLDRGPLVIVTAATREAARDYGKGLIDHSRYGDLVLLTGSTKAARMAEAKRFSRYLYGVDIIHK